MYQLEAGTDVGVRETKKEEIVDESEPVAPSIQSDQGSTPSSKLYKAVALLCSFYDVDCRNQIVEHELGLGVDLIGKLDFVVAN